MGPYRFAPLAPGDAQLLFQELSAMDEDRALSLSFFRDEDRGGALALSRFFAEAAAIPSRVTEPMMGAIRVQWWREALDEVFGDGAVRAHPLVRALAATAQASDRPAMDAALDAVPAFLSPDRFSGLDAIKAAFDPFDGACAERLAARSSAKADGGMLRDLGTLSALARALCVPPSAPRSEAIETPAQRAVRSAEEDRTALRSDLLAQIEVAGRGARGLPSDALPAVLPFALAKAYAKDRPPGPLAKRWSMTRAMLTGRP